MEQPEIKSEPGFEEAVLTSFQRIDIHDARPHMRLGEDIGMDSQELVSLACELQSLTGIKVEGYDFKRSMTVAEVTEVLEQKISHELAKSFSLTEEIYIRAEPKRLSQALWAVENWKDLLPHIEDIQVIYDDGTFQEFWMTVRGVDSSVIKVRSVRKCESERIRFFQPEPPSFLKEHRGEWTWKGAKHGGTGVTTKHEWRLSRKAYAMYPSEKLTTPERVETLLRGHAKFALENWKAILEKI
jgi:hypothetical protein